MNILLIYGGKSCEHDISIITGCLARQYFGHHNLFCCYVDTENKMWLVEKNLTPKQHRQLNFSKNIVFCGGEGKIFVKSGKKLQKSIKIDCAVNCCHGINGEDGAICGILQMSGIPNVESGISASGIAINKILTKYVAKSLDIPTLKFTAVDSKNSIEANIEKIQDEVGFPVIVKPATLGSSIGIALATDVNSLKNALETAFCFDNSLLIELALTDFYELNCSAITKNGVVETSKIEMPLSQHEILTFADKYLQSNQKGFSLQSKTPDQTHILEVENHTKTLYTALNMSGVIRIDFIVDKATDTLFLNEINTIPGSLAYGLWQEKYSKTQFGDILIDQALKNYAENQKLTYRFNSNVLENLPTKGKR